MSFWQPSNRDWSEDFQHENGRYMNNCSDCLHGFVGHKRRTICKACSYKRKPLTTMDMIADTRMLCERMIEKANNGDKTAQLVLDALLPHFFDLKATVKPKKNRIIQWLKSL